MARAQGRNGLSFFRNRLYDSNSGHFTQEDPIGFDGGDHLYAYAGNNPASFTDPFGLSPSVTRDTIFTKWKRPRIDMSDSGSKKRLPIAPLSPTCKADIGQAGLSGVFTLSGLTALKVLKDFRKYSKATDVATTLAYAKSFGIGAYFTTVAGVTRHASNEVAGTDFAEEFGLSSGFAVALAVAKGTVAALPVDVAETLYSCVLER